MNCVWPVTSRFSCLNTRSFSQTCRKFDSLAARLAQRSLRPYSISSAPFQRNQSSISNLRKAPRKVQAPYRGAWDTIRTFASSKRVITQFEELPEDYKDEDGLAFGSTSLSAKEISTLFEKGIAAPAANQLLRILHGRRVAGTLDDPNVPDLARKYGDQAKTIALKWLRAKIPVDEVANAGLRAEQELAEMEADIVTDAERMGIYKPNSGSSKSGEKSTSVYGNSGLDAIRKQKTEEWEAKEAAKKKKKEELARIQHKTGTLEAVGDNGVVLRRPGQNPRLQYYLDRAATALPSTPPEMSKLQRLGPSGLLAFGVVVAAIIFAQVYTPPKTADRMFPNLPPSAATIFSIILVNSLVLFAWRVPPLFRTLNRYFITTPGYPYPLSLIGNVFSHQSVAHFLGNMAVLYFVGTRLHEEIGRGNFLAVYVACGVLGSYASLVSWVLRSSFVSSSLGASGAIYGTISCYLWLNSSEKVTLFGVFPPEGWPSLSAMGFLIFLLSFDVLGLRGVGIGKVLGVDYWAHLGGAAGGIAAAEMLKRRNAARKAMLVERRKNMGFLEKTREGRL